MKKIIPFVALSLFIACAGRYSEHTLEQQLPEPTADNIRPGYYQLTEETDMFESADLGSRKIESLQAGEIVEVVDFAGAFAQIKYSDNAGWLFSDEVEETEIPFVVRTLGKIRVKASPDSRSDGIAILDPGRLITVKKRQGDWVFVKISENRGWIMSGLLEPMGMTDQQPGFRAVRYWKVLKKANLRASPDIISEILRVMPSGASVRYIGTEDEWIHVEYDGSIGYVHEDLVGPY